MLAVLLLVLTVLFPLLLYIALKAVAWLDFRKRVLPRLAAELEAAATEFEGYVHEHVSPRDPRRSEELLRESAVRRRAFAEASQVSGAAYLLRRPGLERTLEELVRAASNLPKAEGPAAAPESRGEASPEAGEDPRLTSTG